ncbi:hypothetical protein EMCRGX_G021611 [Ephydatia muelleri]
MHKQLPLSTRIELLGRLLKLWRRALNGASSAEVTGSSEEGHNSIAMEMALEHLRSVHTAALKRPQECSEVYAVCSKMVASGLRLDVVGTVLDVTHKVQPHTMSVLSLVQEALSHALEELRHTDSEPQDVLSAGWSPVVRCWPSSDLTVVTVPTLWTHVEHSSTSLISDLSYNDIIASILTPNLGWVCTKQRIVFRFPVQESWCELMEAMSSVAEGATGVILARAGRSHVPEEVDEAIWHKLSSGSVVDGLKYSLVAGGVVMKKSLEQLQQESSVPIMSADVFELLIVKKQVSLVVSLPFYIQLSAHLQSPQEDISTELFTKVLSCSVSELSERLHVSQPTGQAC